MKINRYFKVMLILVSVLFIGKIDALTIQNQGDMLILDSSKNVKTCVKEVTQEGQILCGSTNYVYFAHKKSDQGSIVCTSDNDSAPNSGATCTASSWSQSAHQYGVARIINIITGIWGKQNVSNEEYYWLEVLIKYYVGEYNPSETSLIRQNVINSSSFKILNTGKTFSQIISEAGVYANDVINDKNKTRFSVNSQNVVFTKTSDDYYKSNDIVLNLENGTTASEINVEHSAGFTYEKKTDGTKVTYSFKIPVSDIQPGATKDFSVNFSVNPKKVYYSQRYNCGSTVQEVALTSLNEETISYNSLNLKSSITREQIKGSLEIIKTDESGKTILTTIQDQNYKAEFGVYLNNSCTQLKEKISTNPTTGTAKISNLELGTYYVKEITAPKGYKKNDNCFAVQINSSSVVKLTVKNEKIKGSLQIIKKDNTSNEILKGVTFGLYTDSSCTKTASKELETDDSGKVIFNNLELGTYYYKEIKPKIGYVLNSSCQKVTLTESQANITKEVKNSKNKISILKLNSDTGKPLAGAKLHIEDSAGKIVVEQWITETKPYIVEGLPVGIYYVVEDGAPNGYELNKEKLKFQIRQTTENLELKVPNKLTVVEISKINAVDESELPGATLQILDKDKNIISCTVRKDAKTTELLEECTWVSDKNAKKVIGLLPGKYYLKEIIAPEGYVLNEEMVEFEIKEDGTAVSVVMKNELEVDVPDTLSARSTLLIAISMFDIALGIGILTYVKKNKFQE